MSQPNKTRVQVATDSAFSNVVHDVEGAYTTALQIAEDILPKGVNLYARGMHGHPTTGDSSWSTTVQFQIKLAWSDWDGSANGIEYSLNSNQSLHISAVALSDTKVLVSYVNHSNGQYLYSLVLTIDGSTISAGVSTLCHAAVSSFISSVVLSSNKVLLSFSNYSNNSYLYGILLTIDGDTITVNNSVHQCNSTPSTYISAVKLSDTKVLASYRNGTTTHLYAMLLTINGNIITAGAPVQCNSSDSIYVSAVALSDTKVAICYTNHSQSNYLYTLQITINGTTLTPSAPKLCHGANIYWVSAVAVSETQLIICYTNISDGSYLYTILCTFMDSVITVGTPIRCNTNTSIYFSTVKLSESSILACYRSNGKQNKLYSMVITLSDGTLTPGSEIKCNDSVTGGWGDVNDISAIKITNDKVFVAYNKGITTTLYGKILVDN